MARRCGLLPDFEVPQNCQPGIPRADRAPAALRVEVGSALGAEPLAGVLAEGTRGEGQDDLFAHQRRQVDHVAIIDAEVEVVFAELHLAGHAVALRHEHNGEVEIQGERILLQAARAVAERVSRDVPLEEEVLAGAVVLEPHRRRSRELEVAHLPVQEECVERVGRLLIHQTLGDIFDLMDVELHGGVAPSAGWVDFPSQLRLRNQGDSLSGAASGPSFRSSRRTRRRSSGKRWIAAEARRQT